jgi:RNA polymerase sigma factor (sigma-70 family)
MGESFAYKGAMGQGLESLLSNVAAGSTNWPEVYECLRTPLWYAAARGARRVGVRDRDAIAEAVQQAFTEFMALDFATVASPDSIARTIAYRRGLDRGIATRRRWKREAAMETLPSDLLRAEPGQSPGYAESAEEEFFSVEDLRRQEERWRRARDCLQRLTGRQRVVVRESVMKGRTLTDIGNELGISHTAVRKHRQKGLEALRQCVEREQPAVPAPEPGERRAVVSGEEDQR